MTTQVDPRSITDAERPFLDRLTNLGQMADLRRHILALGESGQTANGVIGWLLAKKVGDPDLTASDTRANYRRILRELEAPAPADGDPKRAFPGTAATSGPPIISASVRSTVGAVARAQEALVASVSTLYVAHEGQNMRMPDATSGLAVAHTMRMRVPLEPRGGDGELRAA